MAGQFVDIKVLGVPALQRQLRAIDIRMQKQIVKKAMRKAMQPLFTKVKTTALFQDESGRLRAGLKVKTQKQRRRGEFGVGIITPKRIKLNIPSGSKWYYPAHVELGHGGPRPAPPKPFLRNTFDQNKENLMNDFIKELNDVISGIVSSTGGRR